MGRKRVAQRMTTGWFGDVGLADSGVHRSPRSPAALLAAAAPAAQAPCPQAPVRVVLAGGLQRWPAASATGGGLPVAWGNTGGGRGGAGGGATGKVALYFLSS
jgi:hypothetical protein